MKYPDLLCVAALAAATLGGGSVLAQTAPSQTTPAAPALSTPVVSDVAPSPAEDRSSTGAIVLQDSPVIAQRAADPTRAMGAGPSFGSITHRAPHLLRPTADEHDQRRAGTPVQIVD